MKINKSNSPVSIFSTLTLGIILGIVYWFLDATINVLLLKNESLMGAVFSPEIDQIWVRSSIICLMITFAVIARFINNKRKSIENALIESEDRFRSLIVASSDRIFIHDGNQIIEANQTLADILGYELNEIIGKAPGDFLDEESQKRMADNLKSKKNALFQVIAVRKNGNKVTLEFVNRTIFYYGRTVWIATISDCSVTKAEPEKFNNNSNHYQKLLQNSNDPLFVYGLTNENSPDLFFEASGMACTKFGYTAEEFAKLNIMEIIIPEERDNILPIFQTLIDFKHSIFETEILTKDKDRLPVEISSHLFDLDNRPVIISTMREISERKKANKLLHDSEKQYRRLFALAPVAYLSLDPDGNIIEVNDKWRNLFGYSKEEVVDGWFGDFLTRSSLDRFRAAFADLSESKEKMEIDLEISARDKTVLNIFMVAEVTKNSFGDIQSAQCILIDNSRQKRSTEEKQKQEQWLEQIIDNTSDIVFSFKPDGSITNVNPTFEKVIGKSAASLINSKFDSIVHGDDLAFVRQAIDKCIGGEKIPPIEIRLHTESGQHLSAELMLTPFCQDGKVIAIDCIAKDLSKIWQQGKSEDDTLHEIKKQAETLPDNVSIINNNFEIVYTNKNHQELSEKLGLNADIIGFDVIKSYPFESEESRSIYSDTFDKATSVVREISYSSESDQYIFETKIVPIYTGNEISFAFLIIKDISSQKLSEAALKKSETELSVIFNNSSAILALVDSERRIRKINNAGLKFIDRPEQEILGKRGGEALGCLNHLDDPRGCGYGPNCEKCPVRNTISKTFKTGINHHHIPAKLPFKIDGIEKDLHLLISTTVIDSKDEDLILIAIENITGQKMAEESLQQSEQSYRTLTENLPGLVYRVHCQEHNRMQFFNNLIEELTGYAEQELSSGEICSIEPLIHEDDRPNIVTKIKEDKPFEIEYRLHHKNGDIKYCIEKGQPIFDSDGKLRCIDGVIFDATERKKVEEAFRESEEKYRQIIENAAEGIMVGQDGWLKFVNPQMEKFAGYTKKELLSKPFVEFIHPDDREKVIENHRKRLNGEPVPKTYSFRITTKNNEIKWFEIGGIQITWEKKPASLNFFLDITDRKQAEDVLKASEKRFQDISMSSADWIWETDANGAYTFTSGKVKQILGYEPAELIGKSPFELMPPDEVKHVEEIFRKIALEKKPIIDLENWNLTKEGKPICLLTNGVPILDRQGELIGYRGVDKDITEQKHAEKSLQQISSRNKALLEAVPDIIIEVDSDKVYTWANKAGYDFFGEDVIGKEASSYFKGDQNTYKALEPLFEGDDNIIYIESWQRRKDGAKRLLAWWCRVLKDENGNVAGALSTARDITEIKRAEHIVNRQRDLAIELGKINSFNKTLKLCLENAIEISEMDCGGIYLIDKATSNLDLVYHKGLSEDFIKNSSHYESDSNHAKLIKQGQPLYVIHDELDVNLDEISLNEGLRGTVIIPIRHDNKIIGCLNIASKKHNEVPSEARQAIEIVAGQIGEALARARAEEKLRESEEKFRSIVELSVDGICLIDNECRIIAWNQGQEKITGLKKEDVLNKPIYDMQYQLVPEDRKSEHHYQMLKSVMQEIAKIGKSPYMNNFMETEIARPDGAQRTVEILSFPIKAENAFMICSITRDITDKKLLEEELSKAEKLESIGVLAGGIAHDFNNILTAILGNISLAKMDTIPDSDINTRLIDAEKASERAQYLTRQLLTFSKGGAPIKKTISIRNLIKESARFALHGSNVKGLYDIPNDLSAVDADAGQISQVINNLIINANQAMPDGGTITISAKNVDIKQPNPTPLKEDQYVKIAISDEGTGIPEVHLSRIFDPYFTTKQKGSGLGLATTYSIIKNHDGHIEVESKQGEGTTFTIHLPVSNKPEEIEIEEDDIIAAGGGKILIMDDEDAIRMVTGVALTKSGYKVEFAINGEEAVEKYKLSFEEGHPFDLIFMDLTIPGGMGGQEALEKIKEIDPNARAIVSSGYSNNPVMSEHEKYGFCGVIAKPYKAENLNRIVYQILHGDKIPV